MKFKRVKQIKLYEQIVTRFKEMAERGEIKSGDRLPPERELIQQMGVSRTVLREALRVLEARGILEATHGEGRYFTGNAGFDFDASLENMRESAVLEILDAREALETKIVMLAAENAEPEDLTRLRQIIDSVTDPDGYTFEWNREFHLTIAKASKNTVLYEMLSLILQLRTEVHRKDLLTKKQLRRIAQDHNRIIEAIAARDAETACSVMKHHLNQTRIAVIERGEEDSQDSPAQEAKTLVRDGGRKRLGDGVPIT